MDLGHTIFESDLMGDPANLLSLTAEEMESELASIESHRRLVMLARRLATARAEQAGGFSAAETIPTTMAYCPRDSATLAAETADSAREASIIKEEAKWFVPKISTYQATREASTSKEEAKRFVPKISTYKAAREASTSKEKAKLSVSKISMYKEAFRSYKNIRQRSGESVDSLVDRIDVLEERMPTQPEQARVHTLLFALSLSAQHVILKRQLVFTTRNELHKLAVELEAFDAKQQHRRDRGGRHDGRSLQNYTKGGSHAGFRVSKGGGKLPIMGAKGVTPRRERRGKERDLSQISCYICKRPGHYANNCPHPRREPSGIERA